MDFSNISKGKIQLLIENKILTTNNTNFEILKNHFKGLHISAKEKLVLSYEQTFIENSQLLGQVGNLLLENRKFEGNAKIIKSIPKHSNLPTLKKLEVFNNYSELFDITDINELLLSLIEPYSSIAQKGKMPLIEIMKQQNGLYQYYKIKGIFLNINLKRDY